MRKFLPIIVITMLSVVLLSGCEFIPPATATDVQNTIEIGDKLSFNQNTPTDIDYSLERYNLIKRAYWVNGQREKARMLPCPIADIPLGYIVLFTEGGGVVGKFVVEGKVSSLNSYLTPDSEYYEIVYGGTSQVENKWLPDVDGSYGYNDDGIFFFDVLGNYIEWTGTYLYTDIPIEINEPVIKMEINY